MKKFLILVVLLSSFSIFAMENKKKTAGSLDISFAEIVVNYYLKHFGKNADEIDNPKIKEVGPVLILPYGRLPETTYTKHENIYERYAFQRDKKDYQEGEYVFLVACASRNVLGKSHHDSNKDARDIREDLFEQVVRKVHKSKRLRDREKELLNYKPTKEDHLNLQKSGKCTFSLEMSLDQYTKVNHIVLKKEGLGGCLQRLTIELPKEKYLEMKKGFFDK